MWRITAVALLVGCGSGKPEIGPDPTSNGSTESTTSGSGGTGGESSQLDNQAGFISGSRLRAVFYEASDGARQFVRFRDTQRNEDCDMVTAADGVVRCLPTPSLTATVYFADTGCTVPVALISAGCTGALKKYLRAPAGAACAPTGSRIFPVGEMHTQTVYLGGDGNCLPVGSPNGFDVYSVGAEISPTEFVDAAERVE